MDSVGVGAGVVSRLREMQGTGEIQRVGVEIVAFGAGEGTAATDSSGELGFVNKRSAAWWRLRELLDPESPDPIAIPDDDGLVGDLTAPRWRVMSAGRIAVESKDDIKKRLKRSTDKGDAVVMAFWEDAGEGIKSKIGPVFVASLVGGVSVGGADERPSRYRRVAEERHRGRG